MISIDVETSGPTPAEHALLSLGACLVDDPATGFYIELQPERPGYTDDALAVSGLDLAELARTGTPADQAMRQFVDWVAEVAGNTRPVFVGHNACFDWMFVAECLHRHLGENPFGHSAIDMKSLFMGVARTTWSRTTLADVARRYGKTVELPHHALADARIQAELFREILAEIG